MRRALIDLFEVLATKPEDRDAYLEDKLAAFPYVNGGLFDGEKIVFGRFQAGICGAEDKEAQDEKCSCILATVPPCFSGETGLPWLPR